MQIKLYTIPVFGSERIEDELNRFLRGHRILQMERHFCSDNGGYWAIFVEYVDGDPIAEAPPASRRERKDFTEGMTEEEKQRFDYYKKVRKQLADQSSIPAYLVFTNEELALLAKIPELHEDTVRGVRAQELTVKSMTPTSCYSASSYDCEWFVGKLCSNAYHCE